MNMTTSKMVLALALGMAAGYFLGKYLAKRNGTETEVEEEIPEGTYEELASEYAPDSTNSEAYTPYSNTKVPEKQPISGKIHIISPDEMGEDEEYDTVTYTRYSDKVLADENDNEVKDAETFIGDALDHMGEYEPDCIHVKNDNLKLYVEVIEDYRPYSEVVAGIPRQTEE